MATKMVFVCSCGVVFDISDSTGMEAHIDANIRHAVSEGYVVAAYNTLDASKDRLVAKIKTHRDEKRLVFDLYAEYPAASGNMFGCAEASQNNWAKLATLDGQGAVTYPYTVTTYDERSSYDLIDIADREALILAIATVVQTERAQAAGYINNVLAALDVAAATAAAAPYLAM